MAALWLGCGLSKGSMYVKELSCLDPRRKGLSCTCPSVQVLNLACPLPGPR